MQIRFHKRLHIHLCIQIVLFLVLILIDQFTKYLAVIHLKNQPDVPIIHQVLEFHYLENTGAAFGIFQNRQWMFYLITVLVFVIVAIIFCLLNIRLRNYCRMDDDRFQSRTFFQITFLNYLLIFLSAGAIGNFIDRIHAGYVIDFIYIKWIKFPVFNIADIFVTGSVIMIIIYFIFIYKEDDNFKFFPGKQ